MATDQWLMVINCLGHNLPIRKATANHSSVKRCVRCFGLWGELGAAECQRQWNDVWVASINSIVKFIEGEVRFLPRFLRKGGSVSGLNSSDEWKKSNSNPRQENFFEVAIRNARQLSYVNNIFRKLISDCVTQLP